MNAVTKHEEQAVLPADPMVSMIERVVMDPNADLDKLERMLAMKERVDAQSARVAFSAALSAARADIPPIIKDATVDFTSQKGRTHYRHETLAGIAKQIDPILSKHGLSYRFRTDQGQGGVRVTCIIEHAHGHSEETSLAGSPDTSGSKNSFQAVGSAVTYLQRYTLKAALGLSAEVDDDGQAAAPRPKEPVKQRPSASRQSTADQMIADLKRHGVGPVTSDKRFQQDLAKLKGDAPEKAAQVEAEIETMKKAQNADLNGDAIEH
ncbi:ERF family protein [Thalassobius sp. S69A]|uniref:ERF family protein n=1 Tax=unclassified Thalassovita TaxID=2619711 RepID=UPI003C7C8284